LYIYIFIDLPILVFYSGEPGESVSQDPFHTWRKQSHLRSCSAV